jgi:thiol-disulfide isomerase/thioredoxin
MTLPKKARIGSLAAVRVRRKLLVQSLIAALVFALGMGWWWSRGENDSYVLDSGVGSIALNKVSEGAMLAEVDLEDQEGNLVSTTTFIGEPLIVNFWFTTCEPCRREFPVLVAADARHPDLRFIGVNLVDESETASAFATAYGARFELFFDRDGRLTSAMGVSTAPVTLLVDAGGVVRRQLTGEVSAERLERAIAEVFPS